MTARYVDLDEGLAWQEGYGAFSIGMSGIEDTVSSINRREEHHRTISFEDEFVAFLKKRGIDYDMRYVFG
jgi:hypothetical protein